VGVLAFCLTLLLVPVFLLLAFALLLTFAFWGVAPARVAPERLFCPLLRSMFF
jgi:hypothetical protein